jgi:hypothetical protein
MLTTTKGCVLVDGDPSPLGDHEPVPLFRVIQKAIIEKMSHPHTPVFLRSQGVLMEVSRTANERSLVDKFGYIQRGGSKRFAVANAARKKDK